jgi:hypothetical protein
MYAEFFNGGRGLKNKYLHFVYKNKIHIYFYTAVIILIQFTSMNKVHMNIRFIKSKSTCIARAVWTPPSTLCSGVRTGMACMRSSEPT